MIFRNLFGLEVTPWEAQILAAAYLNCVSIEPDMFEAESQSRIKAVLTKLEGLPLFWGSEVALTAIAEAKSCIQH